MKTIPRIHEISSGMRTFCCGSIGHGGWMVPPMSGTGSSRPDRVGWILHDDAKQAPIPAHKNVDQDRKAAADSDLAQFDVAANKSLTPYDLRQDFACPRPPGSRSCQLRCRGRGGRGGFANCLSGWDRARGSSPRLQYFDHGGDARRQCYIWNRRNAQRSAMQTILS